MDSAKSDVAPVRCCIVPSVISFARFDVWKIRFQFNSCRSRKLGCTAC